MMKKLVTYILRLIILGAKKSVMARELGVTDIIDDLPFALPMSFMIAEAASNAAKRLGYDQSEIVNIKRKGFLVRMVDENNKRSDFESALEVNVYFADQNFVSIFVFADGTNKIIATGELSKN